MRFRRIGVAATTSLVLLLVTAGYAQAEVWQAGGTKFEPGQTETFTSKLKSPSLTLESTVGEEPFELTATGVECVECQIEQRGIGGEGATQGSGSYKLTGVSIVKPPECSTPSSASTKTVVVTRHESILWGLWESHTTELRPVAQIKVSGCHIAGIYELTGAIVGRSSADGVFSVAQPVTYSAAIQKESEVSLKLNGNAASFTGEVVNELSGKFKEFEWGVVEH